MGVIGEVSSASSANNISNASYQGQGSSVKATPQVTESVSKSQSADNVVDRKDEGVIANLSEKNNIEEQSTNVTSSLKEAVKRINSNLESCEAVFGIHEETNRVMIKMVDKETKETIKEFPAEETLDLIAKAWELAGIMVDEKR